MSNILTVWGSSYTGNLSRITEEKKNPGKWVVNVHGSHKGGEISILRENNSHGKVSYGWDEKEWKEIVHTVETLYHKQLDKEVWNFALKRAQQLCDKKNLKEVKE